MTSLRLRRVAAALTAAISTLATGCGGGGAADAGTPDAEAGLPDAGVTDAGADTGLADAGPRDAGAFPPADRPPSAHTLQEIVGVATHPSDMPVGDSPEDTARRGEGLRRLEAAGVRWIRHDFTWSRIEPDRETFVFEPYDRLVDEAAEHGIEVLALLAYGVGWANGDQPDNTPPLDAADFGRYAGAVAEHFRGRVSRYEVWNEPNVRFRFWLGSRRDEPDRWADLCIAAHEAVHAADPDAVVMPGGTAYIPQLITAGPIYVANAFRLRPELADATDALALHAYSAYPPTTPPESAAPPLEVPIIDKLRAFSGILDVMGRSTAELWITEAGWPTTTRVGEEGQAAFLVRAVLLAALGGADTVFIFNLNDGPMPDDLVPEDLFGLIHYDADPLDAVPGEPKPSYGALTVLLTELGSFRVVEDTGSGDVHSVHLTDGDREPWAVWSAGDEADVTVPTAASSVRVVAMDGTEETRTVTGGEVTVHAGGDPVYVLPAP